MVGEKKLRKRLNFKDKIGSKSERETTSTSKKSATKSRYFLISITFLALLVGYVVYYDVDYHELFGLKPIAAVVDAEPEQKPQSEASGGSTKTEDTIKVQKESVKKSTKSERKSTLTKTEEKSKKSAAKSDDHQLNLAADDEPIRGELIRGEKLLKRNRLDEALSHFEKLQKSNPFSPNARFGAALALLGKSEKEKSNSWLKQGIDKLKEVYMLPTSPMLLKKEASILAVTKYMFLGSYRECIALMRRMVKDFPNDVDVLNKYGVLMLTIGKNDRATPVYENVLRIDPDNAFAKVHLGFVLKIGGDLTTAIELLRAGLIHTNDEPNGVQQGKFYFHLGDALFRSGREQEAGEWYQRGADRGFFFSKYQRSLYNVDRLKSRPFWTAQEAKVTDIVKKLESNWKAIRDEALKVMNVQEGLFVHEEESLRNTGEWRQLTLFSRGKKHGECERTPKTCQLVSKMTRAAGCKRGQIKYSIMQPGTHVWPHTGPTNCRLRMHLGLVIPTTGNGTRLRCADETRTWHEGKVMIFDDSFEHEVWQDADSYRIIFIVDIWHPDLTDAEKKKLSPI